MITYGVILLIVGLILWGIGTVVAPNPASRVLIVAGQVVGGIGLILLLVGIALLLIPGLTGGNPDAELDVDAVRAVLGV